MKAISIEKPCQENWAAMTPSEQGAFCGKCQIDVIDFSDKSPVEIKLILQENVGKHMCGRFMTVQLDDINFDYTRWENQSSTTFQSKFVYALLLCFGMTLFSCENPNYVLGEMNVSEMHWQDPSNDAITNPDSLKKAQQEENMHVKGKVAYTPEEEIKPNCTNNELEFIKGDIAVSEEYILGNIAGPIPTEEAIPDTTIVNEISPLAYPMNGASLKPITYSLKVYPNPTSTTSTVVALIEEADTFTAVLYDMKGNIVLNVFSGRLEKGEKRFEISLANFEPGTYLLKVSSSNNSQAVRLQRN